MHTDGAGEWSDPKYQQPTGSHSKHAVHTGGAEIHLGGPGKRHTSEAVGGGPSAGGHNTTFTTMG
jgi:hypothetical protein